MSKQTSKLHEPSAIKTVAFAAIVAGILDIAFAVLFYSVIQQKTTTLKILQSVASGILGCLVLK